MAWIKSHQSIERHPKLFKLMDVMKWDLDTAIGKIHRFWWWCQDYAEDGDLKKHSAFALATACGVSSDQSETFLQSMIEAALIDREPYLRVHDWWDYAGPYLITKYKQQTDKWQRIKDLYNNSSSNCSSEVQERKKDIERKIDATEPIRYLNQKTGKNYSLDLESSNIKFVRARISEGRTIQDFKIVIDKKYSEWHNDEKMMAYLRPETLFNATKFESYLNQLDKKSTVAASKKPFDTGKFYDK